jgi:hypothetical protein
MSHAVAVERPGVAPLSEHASLLDAIQQARLHNRDMQQKEMLVVLREGKTVAKVLPSGTLLLKAEIIDEVIR